MGPVGPDLAQVTHRGELVFVLEGVLQAAGAHTGHRARSATV